MTWLAPLLLMLAFAGPPQDPGFAGSEQCAACHIDTSDAFKTNPHARLDRAANAVGQACESCHGPGLMHAQTLDVSLIRSFKALSSDTTAAVCMNCHKNDALHSNRLFDNHSRQGVTCTSCHSVHGARAQTPLLSQTTTQVCGSCHAAERARFERPFAHLLAPNLMDCASCHAPHGSERKPQLLASHTNQQTCLTCHGDKRGPFAYEHMPVRTGSCASCHEPHGSSNPRMLVRHEVRQLCLECHTNSRSAFGATPPAFHDLRSERFQNCTICHTKVHGSHTSPALLR